MHSEISQPPPLLEVRSVSKVFRANRFPGRARIVVAVNDVSFRIDAGECVAIVGESGSGKSTVARLLLRLERADSGKILLDGEDVLAREPRRASLHYRGRVQMIFQDPFGSLNPVHSVAHHLARPILRHGALNPSHRVRGQLARPLLLHRQTRADAVRARAIELLRTVGLEPAEEFIDRFPYELSGGQRQRVSIARALAVDPDLLIADEPTSMLDVSIRMSVLNLLADLKRERKLALVLITHDLASARYLADRVLVLYRGRVMEDGPTEALIKAPAHPYTRALLASIADADGNTAVKPRPTGRTDAETTGCAFASRCPDVLDVCHRVEPALRDVGVARVRCHLYPDGAQAPPS